MFIPRAILHDEAVFVEPETFKPERFIDNDLPDPADSGVFGFGRRCVKYSSYVSNLMIKTPCQCLCGEKYGPGHSLDSDCIYFVRIQHFQSCRRSRKRNFPRGQAQSGNRLVSCTLLSLCVGSHVC
jgi:Cytochrome P450